MARYKSKEFIPQWDSYKGLGRENWEALNNGKTVELDSVPKKAEKYLEKISAKSKKESE
tara:strand:+ start:620 stop:796 length:177 start_codon:yes stop_codon:yes gene_type:complete